MVQVFFAMLGCTFSFAAMTALVKYLDTFHVFQVVFFRCGVALLIALASLTLQKKLSMLKTERIGMHLLRSLSGLAAMFCFFTAFQNAGLVEVQAIGKSKAIFISLLALFFLPERATLVRIGTVLSGFFAVLLILDPGKGEVNLYLLVGLIGAFLAAFAMICVRKLSMTEPLMSIVTYFMIVGTFVSFWGALPYWQMPTASDLLFLSGTGVFGVLGQICMVRAYKLGEATVVAPFDYLELVWATFFGYLIWLELPTYAAVMGSIIILISHLVLIRSENKAAVIL